MLLKYIKSDIYFYPVNSTTPGVPLSDMSKVKTVAVPVIIAESSSEWSALTAYNTYTSLTAYLNAFQARTGVSPDNVTMPAYFASTRAYEGYTTRGGYTALPNLVDYPNESTGAYFATIGDYYYVCTARRGTSTTDGISSNTTYVVSNSGSITSAGPTASNAWNNSANRAYNDYMILCRINGIITAYGVLIANITADNSQLLRADTGNNATVLNILNTLEFIDPPKPETDPYEPGGTSTTGGGTGDFTDTGDDVGIPSLPSLSAVDTGFISLFSPSAAEVKSLASYMWSSSFDITTFKNIVANPIDCILGLSIVPVTPSTSGTKAVTVGNISTGLSFPDVSSQFVEVDCGTLNINEFWGSYLDYSPYTKVQLYLPYIGIVPIDIDDVMATSIHIVYHVDVLTGACVAYVLCNSTQLYTYIGQCSCNVPITSNDFTNTLNGILSIAGNIGSLVMSGGSSAPTAITDIASSAINALKPNLQKSGALSGTGGLMAVQTPYLICQRPRQSVPSNQNAYMGYPSNITAKLSALSGYTEVDYIELDGIPCTQAERDELMTLLQGGIYL